MFVSESLANRRQNSHQKESYNFRLYKPIDLTSFCYLWTRRCSETWMSMRELFVYGYVFLADWSFHYIRNLILLLEYIYVLRNMMQKTAIGISIVCSFNNLECWIVSILKFVLIFNFFLYLPLFRNITKLKTT